MVEKTDQKSSKSLRVIDPKLYRFIVDELNRRHNIHSYDIQILAKKIESGLTMTFKYGEDYAQSKEVFFEFKTLNDRNSELTDFIHGLADDCKSVMIKDYFKMVKP